MALDEAGRYWLLQLVHSNGTDALLKVFDQHRGSVVAVKQLRLDRRGHLQSSILVRYLESELSTHRSLVHPNIAQLRDAFIKETNILQEDEEYTISSLHVVMDYANSGDLATYTQSYATTFVVHLPEELIRKLFTQLMKAVSFMHRQKIAHRHLKPEHVLVHYDPQQGHMVKICDFGMSKHLAREITHTKVGTFHYMPPEIMRGKGHIGPELDMWSAGVCLFVMAAGNYPFESPRVNVSNQDFTVGIMAREQATWQHNLPEHCSPELRQLLLKLLDPNPCTRMTMEGLLRDEWMLAGEYDQTALCEALFPAHEQAPPPQCEKTKEELVALKKRAFSLLPAGWSGAGAPAGVAAGQ